MNCYTLSCEASTVEEDCRMGPYGVLLAPLAWKEILNLPLV